MVNAVVETAHRFHQVVIDPARLIHFDQQPAIAQPHIPETAVIALAMQKEKACFQSLKLKTGFLFEKVCCAQINVYDKCRIKYERSKLQLVYPSNENRSSTFGGKGKLIGSLSIRVVNAETVATNQIERNNQRECIRVGETYLRATQCGAAASREEERDS